MQWVLSMLSIYASDDEIFKKNYKYVKPKDEYDLWLDNDDELFSGLNELDEKYIRKTNRLRMPKKQRESLKMKKLQNLQERLIAKEAELA